VPQPHFRVAQAKSAGSVRVSARSHLSLSMIFHIKGPVNWKKKKIARLVALNSRDPTYTQCTLPCSSKFRLANLFKPVENHFQDGWKHPKKPKPHVHAIFEIVLTEESLVSFLRYRYKLIFASGSFCLCFLYSALVELSRVSRHANEQLLFHGTNQRCSLGDARQRTRLCNIPECLLCSVIRNSFDVENCGVYCFA